jgi:NitT/TauT family transport system ATP-binding protein
VSAFLFDDVHKVFTTREGEAREALGGLSWDGAGGEVTLLLGPTGSGKTTALRLAAGLEAPTGGRVRIGGDEPAQRQGEIGYVSQHHTLLPWKRVLENVALPLRFAKAPRASAEAVAREALERVGLKGTERMFPHEMSGGMQQRAMLARVLAGRARYWLLDEPFGALDEPTRYALQALLLQLQAERKATVLFVTHNVEEAVYLADRIVVLSLPPARATTVIDPDLPRPRERLSEAFSGRMEAVRRHLDSVIQAG